MFFFKLGDARKCAIYFFCWGSCRSLSTQQSYGSSSFSHWAGHELGYAIQHVTCNLEKHCEKLWDVAWNMLKSIAVDLVGKPTQTHKSSQASGAHKPKPWVFSSGQPSTPHPNHPRLKNFWRLAGAFFSLVRTLSWAKGVKHRGFSYSNGQRKHQVLSISFNRSTPRALGFPVRNDQSRLFWGPQFYNRPMLSLGWLLLLENRNDGFSQSGGAAG